MEELKLVKAAKDHVDFLTIIMNDPLILTSLREVPTASDVWSEAVDIWSQDPDEEDYIVFLNKKAVGWLGVNELVSETNTVSLKIAAILPEFQNKGIGTAAIGLLVDNLRSRGFSKLVLYTDTDNFQAQGCYRKCGFSVAYEFPDVMSNGDHVLRYCMELPLHS